ncbi:MAG: Rnase Y domain-containing protein, partial [Flavobacteriales bacterium]
VGGGFTWVVFNNLLKNKKEGILAEATKEGETIKEKKILQAKEKFLEMKNQHENEVRERNKKLQQGEDKVKSRERELSQQVEQNKRKEKELESQKENLNKQLETTQRKQSELEKSNQKVVAVLQETAKM